MSILVTGVAGRLADRVADILTEDDDLVGADVRPLPTGRPFPGRFYRLRHYAQRRMAEVFRRHRPRVVVHLGQVPTTARRSETQRYTQNVLGTRKVLKLCERYNAERVVVLSTYHVYGAYQANHANIREDAPLRAAQIFPQLSDSVELDHAATTFLWRHRDIETIVLRFVNIVGPSLNNMITRRLRSKRCPTLLGYDPMMQFVHQEDAAQALVLAARKGGWGVYNVAGEGTVSWSHAIRLAGGQPIPLPHFLAYPVFGALSRWHILFPEHMLDYFRYPTVIDDSRLRSELGYAPRFSTVETLRSVGGS